VPSCARVAAARLAASDREAFERRAAALRAWRERASVDPALWPSRLRARNVALERVVEGRCARILPRRESRAACRRVAAEVVPLRGGLSLTPARLALDRPIAIACLVERAP
jgi:hypothetical protein